MLFGLIDVHAVTTAALLVIAGLAVREDLIRQRIPNVLNAVALTLGVGLSCLAAGPAGFMASIGGALLGGAVLLPFYMLRAMGAGDVKFMGAAGSFLGPEGAVLGAAVALVAGAVLALTVIAWRLVETTAPVGAMQPEGAAAGRMRGTLVSTLKDRFPYALAIAIGVVSVLWWRGSLAVLVTAMRIV